MRWSIAGWLVLYSACVVLPWLVGSAKVRRIFAWLLPAIGLGLLLFGGNEPLLRLAAASLGLLYAIKSSILMTMSRDAIRRMGLIAFGLFVTIWPGMDPSGFSKDRTVDPDSGKRYLRGLLIWFLGLSIGFALVLFAPGLSDGAVGWIGIAALLLLIHFGASDKITGLARLCGYQVGPLFDNPLSSRSLADFWTRRWNRPFVEMDRLLLMRPFSRRFGVKGAVFGIFVVSGLLHELAISFPAGGGYGGPMLYFVIQGATVLIERKLKAPSRLLTWAVVLLPLPLLFHGPFRSTFIVPFFGWLHRELFSQPLAWYVDKGLWVLGVMQLLVLGASFQVPFRLKWREELPRLSSMNRKLMVTNGAFIVLTIVAFGVLTLVLHDAFLRREAAAVGLASFAAVFWTLRILVDCFYYKHEDWPEGPLFVIGHALLDSLFCVLVLGYGGYLLWAIAGR